MGFFSNLLGAATGWLTGGPVGAAVGLGSSLFGESQQRQAQSSLDQYLTSNAYQRGMNEGMGYGVDNSVVPQVGGGSSRDQASNQAGGMSTGTLYQNYLQRALQGRGGLSPESYQRQMYQGQNLINQQAQAGRQGVRQELGQRGLMHSGAMAQGMAEVERGRLASLGTFANNLMTQEEQAALSSQQQAAGMYGNLYNQWQAQQSAQPSTLSQIAPLVAAWAQWKYRPNQQAVNPYLSMLQPQGLTNTSLPGLTTGQYPGLTTGGM